MRTLWIFGHQLHMNWKALAELNRNTDKVLMIEARSRGEWHAYHKQKLIFVYSAMRHYANQLCQAGYVVDYRQADTFEQGIQAHLDDYHPTQIMLHLPTDWKMRQKVEKWVIHTRHSLSLEVSVFTEDELFFVPEADWPSLLLENKKWNLEQVYRKLRVRFNILMDGNQPVGGQWNYDTDNRKGPDAQMKFEPPLLFPEDMVVKQVITEVDEQFQAHPGNSEPFIWPVTHAQAEQALQYFLDYRLATFGTYQDAMIAGDPFMSHSLLAGALNFGLLHPLNVIQRAEACYREGKVPLPAAEGFIRQILGWREFVRGVYLLKMPQYAQANHLEHHRPLPAFYWSGDTKMNCVHHAVDAVNRYAYSHHIQRLMVLCNFANLAGISPQAVSDWFNEMYIDALDWVVLPNVLGMGLYADGGVMSSKPYISSGQYIHRMSDSCKSCAYQVDVKVGEQACPFNALYWSMIDRHQSLWQNNPRMSMMVSSWRKMDDSNQQALRAQAELIMQRLDQGTL